MQQNHLNIDDFFLDNARSVDILGQYGLPEEAKEVIQRYLDEVGRCLDWIADSSLLQI